MKLLWISVAACICSVMLFAFTIYEQNRHQIQVAQIANETHTWACSFKNSTRQDYLATRRFALKIRNGERELPAGFTWADIRDAQKRRLDRIAEMRALDCT